MRPPRHYLKDISQKLRSGFLKEAPPAYLAAKTLPPVVQHLQLGRKIPQARMKNAHLVRKLLAKNPDLAFSATGVGNRPEDEPYPLRFARHQYEAMKQGMTEEEAFEKAKEALHDVEDVAFAKLEKLVEQAEKFSDPEAYLSAELAEEVARFKQSLPELRYSDLDARDQGLVDHFLQTRVLKWEEIDRINRMGHPIFVEQFEKLRDILFPSIADKKEDPEAVLDAQATKFLWKALKVDHPELLKTKQPFYVEDYVYWFNKTKETTNMPDSEHQQFKDWVLSTLAIEYELRGSADTQQQYLAHLIHTYFPHLRKEYNEKRFTLPDVQDLKDLLFENKVGYMKHNNKLHVRRFYRLPAILFPEETMTQTLLLDRKRLREVLQEEGELENVLAKAGIDQSKLDGIRQELEQMQLSARARPLEEIDGLNYTSLLSSLQNLSMPEAAGDEDTDPEMDAIWGDLKKSEDSHEAQEEERSHDASSSATTGVDTPSLTDEQINDIIRQIKPEPRNRLQTLEQAYYDKVSNADYKKLRTPLEVEAAQWARADVEAIVRVRLQNAYERKEAARREHDAEKRGVGHDRRELFRYPM